MIDKIENDGVWVRNAEWPHKGKFKDEFFLYDDIEPTGENVYVDNSPTHKDKQKYKKNDVVRLLKRNGKPVKVSDSRGMIASVKNDRVLVMNLWQFFPPYKRGSFESDYFSFDDIEPTGMTFDDIWKHAKKDTGDWYDV